MNEREDTESKVKKLNWEHTKCTKTEIFTALYSTDSCLPSTMLMMSITQTGQINHQCKIFSHLHQYSSDKKYLVTPL